MVDPSSFLEDCRRLGVDFFAGVPDSLLKSFCAELAARAADPAGGLRHVIAANEGGAVALAAGHFLATGRPGLVYLQNSGEGNAVNPLLSLSDPAVYGIPMVLLVGWRGEPGVPDEPQHKAQGECTLTLLDALRVPNEILPPDEEAAEESLVRLVDRARAESRPVALVVRKGTFAPGAKAPVRPDLSDLSREDALRALLRLLPPDARVVGSTGMISREIFELREHAGEPHDRDFLTVGSMGHASQIALGVHLARPDLPVVAVEGDGAALMHLGAFAIVGRRADGHFLHIVLNNAAHDSVGGQPTVADSVDLPAVARACGYSVLPSASTLEGIAAALADGPFEGPRPSFLEIRVRKGARKDLGRPTVAPAASKTAFMAALRAER